MDLSTVLAQLRDAAITAVGVAWLLRLSGAI
jgi:hypothetical protein